MIRNHHRLNSFSAFLVAIMLLMPAEHVFGAMCTMEKHADGDVASDTCCPETGKSESAGNTEPSGSPDASGSGHCDMDNPAGHYDCEDCECFFIPFSDSRSSTEYGITVNQVLPDLSFNSTHPLFTISSIIYREHTDPAPSPSRIPIYLANKVFLN